MIDRRGAAHYVEVILNLPVAAVATVEPVIPVNRQARLKRMIQDDYRLIWRLLRRLGVPADGADDATQQVFLIAAERLAEEGVRAEVLDLRTLKPLDTEAILTTVRKTGKVLIVHAANRLAGVNVSHDTPASPPPMSRR